MATYTITYLDADGSPLHTHELDCASDDEVIDRIGDSDHPHGIDVHEGARHVVRFPPWP